MAIENVSYLTAKKTIAEIQNPHVNVRDFPLLKNRNSAQMYNHNVMQNPKDNMLNQPKSSGFIMGRSFAHSTKNNSQDLTDLSPEIIKLAKEIQTTPDIEKLWERIWKTIESHRIVTRAISERGNQKKSFQTAWNIVPAGTTEIDVTKIDDVEVYTQTSKPQNGQSTQTEGTQNRTVELPKH